MNAKTETEIHTCTTPVFLDEQDDGLDAARGIMFAIGVGLLMWAAIIPTVLWVLR
jgi:hypothetical protein